VTSRSRSRFLALRVRTIACVAGSVLTLVGTGAAELAAVPDAVWVGELAAGALLVSGLYNSHLLYRAREQREAELAARAEARAELRRRVRTLAAPDAQDGQCPVCGLDDLDALAADDASLEQAGSWRRVVEYGRRRVHRECAELVPLSDDERAATPTDLAMLQVSWALYSAFGVPPMGLSPAQLQHAVASGRLSISHARELLGFMAPNAEDSCR